MYYVQENELDTIGSSSGDSSLYMGFAGIASGAALTLGVTLSTVDIANPKTYAAYWGAFIVTLFCSLFLIVKSIQSYRKSRKEVQRIVEQSQNREP